MSNHLFEGDGFTHFRPKGGQSRVKRRFWSAAEVAALRVAFADSRTDDLAVRLGRTYRSVALKAKELGLTKSAAYLTSQDAHRFDGRKGEGTRFAKGMTPWNKGLPGSTGTHENCRRTQFKAGRPAHEARNYQPIGALRLSKGGYPERKVTDDPSIVPAQRWVAVARLVWEATHGPIPAGHAVVFRKGLRTTEASLITLDRLELVTRVELMARNSMHRHGPEVARLTQLRGAISRQINRKAKEQQA